MSETRSQKSARMPQAAAVVVAVVVAAVLLFAGYSWGERAGEDRPAGSGIDATAQRASATAHNAQDVRFTQLMVPHHEQATRMAALAATRAQSPDVKALAEKIAAAQAPEIERMKGWLTYWDAGSSSGSTDHGGDHGGMTGMMSDADLGMLAKASGERFDTAFLRMMVKHHQGAVTMADEELRKGRSADALALATSIVVSQEAEVTQMRGLLD